jgi:TetR/AcrR family transcriptional repressor of nem operon
VGRSSDARERIVDTACELFYQHGYQAVGVQEICEAAGVKKGSFYHFFRSKQELALAMLDEMWERLRKLEFEPAFRPDLAPLERIERYLELTPEVFAAFRTPDGQLCGCPFGNMALEMSTHDEPIRCKVDAIFRAWATYLAEALDEAVARGDLPPLDSRAAAESVVAYLSGVAVLAKTRNSLFGAERLREQVLALIHPRLPERLGRERSRPAAPAAPPAS